MKSIQVRSLSSQPINNRKEAMKKILAALILVTSMFITGVVCAEADITASWSPNPETDLAGYLLYMGTSSGQYDMNLDVGNNVTGTFSHVADGMYYVAVKAYDTSGNESGYSQEAIAVIDTVSPGDPTNVIISIHIN